MADRPPVVNRVCSSKPGAPIQLTGLVCANTESRAMNRPLNILAMAQTRRRSSLIPQFQASSKHAGGHFHTDLGKTPTYKYIPAWGHPFNEHAGTLKYENEKPLNPCIYLTYSYCFYIFLLPFRYFLLHHLKTFSAPRNRFHSRRAALARPSCQKRKKG